MRMNQEASLTAYEVVNHYDYHDLVRIFFKYGEDKFSKQIARKIEASAGSEANWDNDWVGRDYQVC